MIEISLLMIFIIIIGFYMAWNIGSNDLANAMASAVGAGTNRETEAYR